ncbi:MAG: DUF3332 family protein [Spirochaetia bacterium]|nr:DUF3332 family protein [Spirochaetia bacterium]
MTQKSRLVTFTLLALAGTMTLQSCLSGGWKITRMVAKWNNGFAVFPRILIYIAFFLLQVYTITSLIDGIVFNTIDFWNGTISAMNYKYQKDGMDVAVVHSRFPLRRSVITTSKGDVVKSVVEVNELENGKIALVINGVLRGEFKNIQDVDPTLVLYKEDSKTELLSKAFSTRDVQFASSGLAQSPRELLEVLNIRIPNTVVAVAK